MGVFRTAGNAGLIPETVTEIETDRARGHHGFHVPALRRVRESAGRAEKRPVKPHAGFSIFIEQVVREQTCLPLVAGQR